MKTIEIVNNKINIKNNNGFSLNENIFTVLSDTNIFIYITKSNIELNFIILKDIKAIINLIVIDSNITLNYQLKDDSNLIVNCFNIDTSSNIKIELEENASIKYNYSIISNIINKLKMNVIHQGNNSKSEIFNHGINVLELLEFDVSVTVPINICGCSLMQDNKIIYLTSAKSIILPNLLVENNDIIASHNAYIGKFNEEDIFYLLTRGINKSKAISLMIKGNLLGNMNNDYKFLSECLKLI